MTEIHSPYNLIPGDRAKYADRGVGRLISNTQACSHSLLLFRRGTCHSRNGSICFPNQPLEALVAKYPKIEKGLPRLSQDDSLRGTTIQLIAGALLSAGLLLSGTPSAEAKSIAAPTLSAPSSQGNAIILAPSSGMTKQGSTLLAGHFSHSSHASHTSHQSHYSSR